MSINYKDFYDYAAAEVIDGSPEFSLRNGMSRSYYSVYHLALEYADSVAVPPVSDCKGPTHRKLSEYFEKSFNADMELRRTLRRLGYSLKQLHDNRVTADYHLDESVTFTKAKEHLLRCDLRLKDFQSLLSAAAA
ncbi:hypothetical protein [Pseudomonas sp. FFUP_PS_473]|uniref:hypothetical protein n=1 Tax=Pseudomonas sp. FFUP_PS_473 TaxID=2060418 RepID=UPI0011AEBC47|nr:hypothetical protein [Pseudomonas sp. FFUP_PS_473]